MKIQSYLVISSRGTLRMVKGRPALSNDEVAIQLNIDVPNSFFKRLIPVANLTIPDNAIFEVGAEVALSVTAQEVSDKLHIEQGAVLDGLKQAYDLGKETSDE